MGFYLLLKICIFTKILDMNYSDFTLLTQNALKKGTQIAQEKKHAFLQNGHALKGIMDVDKNVSPFLLKRMRIELSDFKKYVDELVDSYVAFNYDGTVAVNIARKDYQKYKEEYTFDELCHALGDLFRRFLEYYRDGKEEKILEELSEKWNTDDTDLADEHG